MSVARGVAKGVGAGVLAILAVIALAVVVVPAVTGSSTYTIMGRSMEPAIPIGSLIVTRPVDAAEVRTGDVVTFQLESGAPAVATHRVIGFEQVADGERGLLTRGDANDSEDPEPVLPEQLRGVVWYSVPFVGWVNSLVTGEVRAWLVPLAIVSLFAYGGWSLVSGIVARGTPRAPGLR
jgi:signal peptidase